MTPLLVFGRHGQVARELARLAPKDAVFLGHRELDLVSADPAEAIAAHRPAAVINAAGYTAVDAAESEPALATRVNGEAPGQMARACAQAGIPFVHISSDYVFSGGKAGAYREDDAIDPQSAYGRSKAQGELRVAEAGGDFAILRTSWVYSSHGANFLKTMLRLGREREEVRVVADQCGRPTWARDVADAALQAAGHLLKPLGVLHAAGPDPMSWADFAEAIFATAAAHGLPHARVRRIATADYPTPARRPANSVLEISAIDRVLGWRPTPLTTALDACLAELETLF